MTEYTDPEKGGSVNEYIKKYIIQNVYVFGIIVYCAHIHISDIMDYYVIIQNQWRNHERSLCAAIFH